MGFSWYSVAMLKNLRKLVLLIGDIAVLYLALYLTLLVRYVQLPTMIDWSKHFLPFSIAFVAWILIFYIADLYNLHTAVNNSRFFANASRAIIIAGLLSIAFFYLMPGIEISPKRNMLIYVVMVFWLLLVWRRLFNRVLDAYLPKHQVAVIGWNAQVRELLNAFLEKPHLGYRISVIYSSLLPADIGGVNFIGDIPSLNAELRANHVDTNILAENLDRTPALRQTLFACLPLHINFISLPNFYELITGKVPIEAITQMWFLENLNERDKNWYDAFKRLYDLIIAFFIFIVSLPLWPLIALTIKLESKGPVFINMERAGRNNIPFRMLKFRTMREEGNARTMTVRNDPRITAFGSFMRRTRLDELPQVWNILTGDMSFIGPRPERPELVTTLENEIPFYRERTLIKPGITGWDQVSGEYHSPSREDTLKKLQYDLFYIKHRSPYLDLSILLKTIATVLRRSGI
jgi:exopolysaccharide biosynthesis polyprenyl glycosylphosphotransferase